MNHRTLGALVPAVLLAVACGSDGSDIVGGTGDAIDGGPGETVCVDASSGLDDAVVVDGRTVTLTHSGHEFVLELDLAGENELLVDITIDGRRSSQDRLPADLLPDGGSAGMPSGGITPLGDDQAVMWMIGNVAVSPAMSHGGTVYDATLARVAGDVQVHLGLVPAELADPAPDQPVAIATPEDRTAAGCG